MIEHISKPSEVVFHSALVEPETHPLIKKLVCLRYDYSQEKTEEELSSGAYSQYRNGWYASIAVTAELLKDEGYITQNVPYARRLRRLANAI